MLTSSGNVVRAKFKLLLFKTSGRLFYRWQHQYSPSSMLLNYDTDTLSLRGGVYVPLECESACDYGSSGTLWLLSLRQIAVQLLSVFLEIINAIQTPSCKKPSWHVERPCVALPTTLLTKVPANSQHEPPSTFVHEPSYDQCPIFQPPQLALTGAEIICFYHVLPKVQICEQNNCSRFKPLSFGSSQQIARTNPLTFWSCYRRISYVTWWML